MEKRCIKCGKMKSIKEFYYRYDRLVYRNDCKECFNKARSEYSRDRSDYYKSSQYKKINQNKAKRYLIKKENQHKIKARLLATKKFKKELPHKCEICGVSNAEKHHPIYRNPLLVKWLCRKHHIQTHYPPHADSVTEMFRLIKNEGVIYL